MKTILFLLLYLLANLAIAQRTTFTLETTPSGEKVTRISRQTLGRRGYVTATFLYRGSIFFNDNFQPALIRVANGKPMTVPVRYNIYTDELTARFDSLKEDVLLRKTNFFLDNQAFVFVNDGFVALLYGGKSNFFKKYMCRINDLGRGHGGVYTGGDNGYDGEVVRTETYYLFIEGQVKAIELTKKSLLDALGHHRPGFDAFVQTQIGPGPLDEQTVVNLLKSFDETTPASLPTAK